MYTFVTIRMTRYMGTELTLSHYRPGQALGAQKVGTLSVSRQSAPEGGNVVCQPYALSAFTLQVTPLVLISVRGWVEPRAIVRPEKLKEGKIPMTPSNPRPSGSCHLWDNVEIYRREPERQQTTILCMPIACWVPQATNTHSEYVILFPILLQQWLHERASVLRNTYTACLINTVIVNFILELLLLLLLICLCRWIYYRSPLFNACSTLVSVLFRGFSYN